MQLKNLLGVRTEVASAKDIFQQPEIVQGIKDKLIIECEGDLANAIIPRNPTVGQSPEVEDLHDVLLVGLDAGLFFFLN